MADSKFLRYWIIILVIAAAGLFAHRVVSSRHLPHSRNARVIWRTGKVPSGVSETLTFSKRFTYPPNAVSLKFYIHAFPSYILFLNGERAGGGWEGDHLYDLSPLTLRGSNQIMITVPTHDGFGYLLCSAIMDGAGSGLLSSDKSWELQGKEGPLDVREFGSPPVPFLDQLKPPVSKALFPTYAGGDFIEPEAVEWNADRRLYDLGRSMLVYPVISGDPFQFAWAETRETALEIPPIAGRSFPGTKLWTTTEALNLRYISISSEGQTEIKLQPVTGPYPP